MQESLIDTPEALSAFAEQLRGSEWLALDTEFIRQKTYFPQLCLLQISNGEQAACVDPLALEDLSPLLAVINDGSILKLFHAGRQDLEIFLHEWGHIPLPLFDTQIAAALLGHGDQIGYAKLVKEVLDVDLAKDQSLTDWSQRPLDDQQLRYALDDVIYLGQLFTRVRADLADAGRLPWLAADFAELADPATYVQHPQTAWQRVKGRQQIKGQGLAVLQRLAAWREQEARARDIPRKWVLRDDLMLEIARRKPVNTTVLARIRGLEPGQIRRDGERLIEEVTAARALPPEEWPRPDDIGPPLAPAQEAQVDLLSAAMRLIAAQHQLAPGMLGSRKDLEKLVRHQRNTRLLEGWRKSVAGAPLQQILMGDAQVVNRLGGPRIEGVDD